MYSKEKAITSFDTEKKDAHIKAKILVVDDEAVNVILLQKVLKQYYTDIYVANDGEEAKNIVYEIMPDLIISDIQMPKIDGLELTRILKEDVRTKHLPIILFSAFSKYYDKVLTSGCDDYISKPIVLDKLLAKIKVFIH